MVIGNLTLGNVKRGGKKQLIPELLLINCIHNKHVIYRLLIMCAGEDT